MSDKKFTTIEEQLEILQTRGLIISNKNRAADFLRYNNYYRVSGYSLTLRDHDKFYKGITFQNIIDIYEFDHGLRHILLKYIEIIEVTVKSIYSHEFARNYGSLGYLDSKNFTDTSMHKKIIDKADQQKDRRLPHEPYLKHYVNELKQPVPFWAYIDLLTISDMSFLYSISESQLKITVAKNLGLNIQGDKILGKFMHSMTIVRNLCAHGSRLYNRLFEQKPWLSKKERLLLSRKKDGSADDAHLFGFILVMRRLLNPTDFLSMKTEIMDLIKKYPFVKMKYYGFPDNWENIK